MQVSITISFNFFLFSISSTRYIVFLDPSYGIELPENQDAYISEFRILLSDSVSIVFKNFYDYGHVWTEDWLVDISTIKWEELKKGIKENNKK